MWVNPFGVSFNHIRRSDLVRIDYKGNVLEGGSVQLINRAAVLIHAAGINVSPEHAFSRGVNVLMQCMKLGRTSSVRVKPRHPFLED